MEDVPDARVHVSSHPIVAHRVTQMRDVATPSATFRRLLGEAAALVAFEAFADLSTSVVTVDTPVTRGAEARSVTEEVLLVPILRAGLGMVPSIQELLPVSAVAHVGLRRDERTLRPAVYLDRLPKALDGRRVAICDPMLATGGSLSTVISMVKAKGATRIDAVCIIAAAPGIARVLREHPEVTISCAVVDRELNSDGFITPGLGDAGDRLFGPPSG